MKKATHSEEQSRPRKADYSTLMLAMSSPVLQALAVMVAILLSVLLLEVLV